MNEVVVTAMGAVSPFGTGIETFSTRMFAGESGVKSIRGTLVGENFPVPYAAMVDRSLVQPSSLLLSLKLGAIEDATLFASVATEEALKDVPSSAPFDAIVYGTAEGVHFDQARQVMSSFDELTTDLRPTRSQTSTEILAKILEARGHGKVDETNIIPLNSACAGGNQAVSVAFQRIRAGQWTRVLVGGVDARCQDHNLMNFNMLGALTTANVEPETASRPFSKSRSGFVRGEAAATLVLESKDAAIKRGAKILAYVVGSANTSDAFRLTDGHPDGKGIIKAMEKAIADAGIAPSAVSAVSAHGTSTPMNDSLETKSIKAVFKELSLNIPVTSLKSQVGHSTVAAGAIESVACVLMLQEQTIAPTINLHDADPECDLDYVPNHARKANLNYILSNNIGFGGQNSCIVFKKA